MGLFGLVRKQTVLPSAGSFGGADAFALWRSTKKVPITRAMDVYSNWTYACIRAIAEELADARFRLFEIKSDGTHQEIFDHPILDLIEGVNNYQTGYEIRYLLASHLEMAGNAYWLLEGGENGNQPTAIYPLNPRNIKSFAAKQSPCR